MRCFIALPLPHDARELLRKAAAVLSASRPGLVWASPASYHVTLAFLGEIEGISIDCARKAIRVAAAESAFPFRFSSLGVFPPRGRMRVLVARIFPEENSHALHDLIGGSLAAEMGKSGLDRLGADWPDAHASRSFAAHVTLARSGRRPSRSAPDGGDFETVNALFAAADTGPWTIDRCVLYKSELRPSGAVYSELESVNLA
jgi:2'-5' RNA ligase